MKDMRFFTILFVVAIAMLPNAFARTGTSIFPRPPTPEETDQMTPRCILQKNGGCAYSHVSCKHAISTWHGICMQKMRKLRGKYNLGLGRLSKYPRNSLENPLFLEVYAPVLRKKAEKKLRARVRAEEKYKREYWNEKCKQAKGRYDRVQCEAK